MIRMSRLVCVCILMLPCWSHAQTITTTSAPPPPARRSIELTPLGIIDVPGYACEIIAYCPSQKILVVTDSHWKTLDVFHVTSLDPPVLQAIDFDDESPDVAEGIALVREPTSVAVHPTLPIALVTVLGRRPGDPGTVFGFDLRHDSLGRMILKQPVGPHPDSLAISPDGKYAVVACEAERDPDAPGGVWVIDLSTLTMDRYARDGELPAWEVPGLKDRLRMPVSEVEPEYVAFDPQSRFALVSCQENNLVLTLDLTGDAPTFGEPIYLTAGAEPDGVSVLDEVTGPDGRVGCLIGVAEEGKLGKYGQVFGHSLSFHWIDPDDVHAAAEPVARVDTRLLTRPDKPTARRDPEAIQLTHFAGRPIAVAATERGDYLLALDLADITRPTLLGRCKIGDRPEGLILIPHGDDLIAVTGDEGGYGPGTVSFVRLRAVP